MKYNSLTKKELIRLLEERDAELYETRKERDEALKKLEEINEAKAISRAKLFKRKLAKKVLLVAGDVYRPAAIDQLCQIGKQIDVEVLNMGDKISPVEIAKMGVEKAKRENFDVVIILRTIVILYKNS